MSVSMLFCASSPVGTYSSGTVCLSVSLSLCLSHPGSYIKKKVMDFDRIGPIRFLAGCRKRRLNQG